MCFPRTSTALGASPCSAGRTGGFSKEKQGVLAAAGLSYALLCLARCPHVLTDTSSVKRSDDALFEIVAISRLDLFWWRQIAAWVLTIASISELRTSQAPFLPSAAHPFLDDGVNSWCQRADRIRHSVSANRYKQAVSYWIAGHRRSRNTGRAAAMRCVILPFPFRKGTKLVACGCAVFNSKALLTGTSCILSAIAP